MLANPIPLPRTPALLVQQAARALRAGEAVTMRAARGDLRVLPAELAGESALPWPDDAFLAISGQRLASLTGTGAELDAWRIPIEPMTPPGIVAALADPTLPEQAKAPGLTRRAMPADEVAEGAIELCKLAGLLPAAVCMPPARYAGPLAVGLAAVREYRLLEAMSLRPVSEARVPLQDAENARVVAFRPADGGPDQFAIMVGEPEAAEAPLCRLHSECFTGDLLGSLRCDCGDQLRGAIRRMAEEGAGVLIYLAQEGRGIGLTNKLRAYTLQDSGLDTVDANTHLGFEADERQFQAAATMLRQLGISRVRVLTNNPAKLRQLAACGIEVVGRVPHMVEPNAHNQGYLLTKALRAGHMLELDQLDELGANGARYRHG